MSEPPIPSLDEEERRRLSDPANLSQLDDAERAKILDEVKPLEQERGAPLSVGFPLDAAVVCDDPECSCVYDGTSSKSCPRCSGKARTAVTRIGDGRDRTALHELAEAGGCDAALLYRRLPEVAYGVELEPAGFEYTIGTCYGSCSEGDHYSKDCMKRLDVLNAAERKRGGGAT